MSVPVCVSMSAGVCTVSLLTLVMSPETCCPISVKLALLPFTAFQRSLVCVFRVSLVKFNTVHTFFEPICKEII